MIIHIIQWIALGLSCWSKIPCLLTTISVIKVNLKQDLMASRHSKFFQGQMDEGLFNLLKFLGNSVPKRRRKRRMRYRGGPLKGIVLKGKVSLYH
jgi:hypothetical protein